MLVEELLQITEGGDHAEADKNLRHLVIRLYMLAEELLQITEGEAMQKPTRTRDTWSSGSTCWLKNYYRLPKGRPCRSRQELETFDHQAVHAG